MAKIDDIIYIVGGSSDELSGPKPNEDYFALKALDKETLFIAVADGMGGKPSELQPAAIACTKAIEAIERLYEIDSEVFLANPVMMLKEAVYSANNVLGAFKMANEEKFAGFAASVIFVLVYDKNKFAFAHVGSCRMNLIRIQPDGSSSILQVTADHTSAMDKLNEGIITQEEFYMHPDRYVLTSALGVVNDPVIQHYNGKLKQGDMLLITTDGIHYHIKPEYLARIVLEAQNWKDATDGLIQGARLEKVSDNATAVLFINPN